MRLRSRGGSGCRIDVHWSRRRDSNPKPAVYKTAALPIELRRRDGQGITAEDPSAPGNDRAARGDGSSVGGRGRSTPTEGTGRRGSYRTVPTSNARDLFISAVFNAGTVAACGSGDAMRSPLHAT